MNNLGTAFTNIINDFEKLITDFSNEQYNKHIQDFLSIVNDSGNFLALYLGIFLIYETIRLLYGKGDQNFSGFLFTAFVKIIFILLALNAADWVQLVFKDISAARDALSQGGTDVFSGLRRFLHNCGRILAGFINSIDTDNTIVMMIGCIISTILLLIGIGIGVFSTLKATALNILSFVLLMLLMPIAFFFLIFGATKQTFSQWLNMVLSNLITLLCLHIFVGAIILGFAGDYTGPYADNLFRYSYAGAVKAGLVTDSPYSIAFKIIGIGILINIFTSLATSIAEKFTMVSMEGIANSTFGRAMGLAGRTADIARGGSLLAARGTLGAARGAVGAGKGVIKAGSMGIKGAKAAKNKIGKLIGRK